MAECTALCADVENDRDELDAILADIRHELLRVFGEDSSFYVDQLVGAVMAPQGVVGLAQTVRGDVAVLVRLLRLAFSYAESEGAYWTEDGGTYGALSDEERDVLHDAGILDLDAE